MPEPRPRLIIRANYARLAMKFASTDSSRFYLQGFYAQPAQDGGLLLVTTDGHRMSIFHEKCGRLEGKPQIWTFSGPELLSLRATERMLRKTLQGAALESWLDITWPEGEQPTARMFMADAESPEEGALPGTSFPVRVIDGTFPDWERVVYQQGATTKRRLVSHDGAFSARYLRGFVELANDWRPLGVGEGSMALLQWESSDRKDLDPMVPAVIQCRPDMMGILMPIRDDMRWTRGAPTWFVPARFERAAA
jgi:hypothetical protein